MKNTLLALFLSLLSLSGMAQTITISSTTACSGDPMFFSYQQTGLVEPISCQWDFGDGAISWDCSPAHTFPSTGQYTVCLTLTDAVNTQVSDCVEIITPIPPVPNISIDETGFDPDDGILCQGDTVTLDAGVGYLSYQWSTGESTQSIWATEAGDYTVTVLDADGCLGEGTVTISLSPPLSAAIEQDCYSLSNDTLTAVGIGGAGAYQYLWSTGLIGAEEVGITGTNYTVTVIDANYCTAIASVTAVTEPTNYEIEIIDGSPNTLCEGDTVVLDAGNGQLAYQWSTGEGTQSIVVTESGDYSVTVTMPNGCGEQTSELGVGFNPVQYQNDFIEICEGESYSVGPSTYIIGGVYTDVFGTWLGCDSIVTTTLIVLPVVQTDVDIILCYGDSIFLEGAWQTEAGIYQDTLISQTGCDSIVSTTLDIFLGSSFLPQPPAPLCPGDSVTLNLLDTYPAYLWSDGSTNPTLTVAEAGIYTVTVTNPNGCLSPVEFPVYDTDCVWPGDANYDGSANNQDVLYLGIAYGNTGLPRTGASLDWAGQMVDFEWDSVFTNINVNQKHADCDGDGIVTQDDTLAISQNYNLPPHALKLTGGGDYELQVNFDQSTANYGEYVDIQVNLSDLAAPSPEAHGIAFSLVFNYPEVINEGSIQLDFSNSVFGTEAELITFSKILLDDGRMDFAVTRFDRQNVSGIQGEVMRLRFIIEDNIDGFVAGGGYSLQVGASDILCLKAWGGEVPVAAAASSEVNMLSVATQDPILASGMVECYPNPTKAILHIRMKDGSDIKQIRVFDTLGRLVVLAQDIPQSMSTDDWQPGVYFLEVTDGGGHRHLLKVIKE